MNKLLKLAVLVAFILATFTLAQAQATRTWVSGVGDDVNPCSRTAPCKTFAGAISKTAVDGEIDALDPGGYGTVTITKSITIDGTGTFASILASGTNGINVNIGVSSSDPLRTVRIRGISINGAGASTCSGVNCGTSTGVRGISFTNGSALFVEDTVIDGFTTAGISVNHAAAQVAELYVRNSSIRNITADGVLLQNTAVGGLVIGSFDNAQIANCGNGLNANQRSRASLRGCTITTNTTAGIVVQGTSDVDVSVDSCSVTWNPDGVLVNTGTARVGNCLVTGNSNGLHQVGGTLETYGTNRNRGNTNNTLGTISPVLPS